jgi:hypothetical protein
MKEETNWTVAKSSILVMEQHVPPKCSKPALIAHYVITQKI